MDWHQFLLDERARKIGDIDALSSGTIRISVGENGNIRDVSAEMIAEHQRHVAEIEEILASAGKSVDA